MSAPTAERTAAVTPEQFRTRFPVLEDTVHLACCSLAPRSLALDGAVQRMLEVLHEDPTPWDFWYGEVERGRQRFARLVGADAAQVAVLPGATVSAFQVASTLTWHERSRIVATDAEYSSLAQVWAAQQPRGAQVTWVPERSGVVAAEDVVAELDERVALVSVPHVSYRTGARLPVADVVAAARAVGARTFVDAYQSLGVLPVDVVQMGCDYLVSGVMKYLLGLPGVAYLYVREGVSDQLDPQLTGFFGRSSPLAFDPAALDFPAGASRFQIGIPTLPVALAANAGFDLVELLHPVEVERHVTQLAQLAVERLTDAGAALLVPADERARGPQVAIVDPDPVGLAAFLNSRRIFPARGHVVRLSFHYYSSGADVEAACTAVADWSRR